MDAKQVHELEDELESAMEEVLRKWFPGPPVGPRTTHLMAKAAVAVLEAVAEHSEHEARRVSGH